MLISRDVPLEPRQGHYGLEDSQTALGTRQQLRQEELTALGALSRYRLVQGQQGLQVLRDISAKVGRQSVPSREGEQGHCAIGLHPS